MTEKKRKILSIVLIAASAGLAVLAYFILPDSVVVQFSMGSSGNSTAPKLPAILLPAALGIGGGVATLFSKSEDKASWKSLFVSALGVALGIFMIVVNSLL